MAATKRTDSDAGKSSSESSSGAGHHSSAHFLRGVGFGAISAVFIAVFYVKFGRRVNNGDHITARMFNKKRWIKGVVTSVGDSDNFRLFHTPAFGWCWPFKFKRIPNSVRDLKDQTIHIRIAGVDAPEAAHFGRPAQPFAAESLAWTKNKILGKKVYCQVYHRDQYSRIVAYVTLSPRLLPGSLFTGKSLALEMLKAGWGTTYTQSGAQYGALSKEIYLAAEAEAKVAKRGMWQKGTKIETPGEYKRRYAQGTLRGDAPEPVPPSATRALKSKPIGLLRRIWSKGK
ncbi:hypothetical protein AMATHDRAFT_67417 [Amanita thiersii Skay4041]|uniref:TNase-like domain-containing protein n=1 Tax=Amanita thiersii Skay4041 TaxID=703135 RepID=A0A2A9NH75_9AGAR|nr:hypothetical protein AMATHDRAFT_67417 [Amanita thiersii Skay4041]